MMTTAQQKILIVCSSTDTLELKENKKEASGFFLNELVVPALQFLEAGYTLIFATPNGKKPIMHQHSAKIAYFQNDQRKLNDALHFVDTDKALQNPLTLKEAAQKTEQYVAVFVPGGHVPMNDLMQDPALGAILHAFHKMKKPTAFLCHGPIATIAALPEAKKFRELLVADDHETAKKIAKNWLYAGYCMTVFSNNEEKTANQTMCGEVQFYAADALRDAGGIVENAPDFEPFVVQDRELITGQNPASDLPIAKAILQSIKKQFI